MNASESVNVSRRNLSVFYGDECHSEGPLLVVLGTAYSVVVLLGLLGNMALLLSIARQRELHNVTHLLIANLSVCDALMSLLCVPSTFVYTHLDHWPFGAPLCQLNSMAQCCAVTVSILSLVTIAVERHQLILHPRGWRPSNRHAYAAIAVIWALGVATATPLLLVTVVTDAPLRLLPVWERYEGKVVCVEEWPSHTLRLTFTSAMLLLQYVAPLAFIFACYVKIYARLRTRRGVMLEGATESRHRRSETRRINILLFSMVVAFAVCWLPLNLFNTVLDWHHQLGMTCTHNPLFSLCHLVAMASVCVNPLLYGLFNTSLQRDLRTRTFWRAKVAPPPPREECETIAMSTVQTTDVSRSSPRPGSLDL